MDPRSPEDGLAVELANCYAASPKPWEIEQIQHRLNLLKLWTTDDENAFDAFDGKTVLEIGCGQGDMTIALAHAVGPDGKVIAVDPAPLDYGSPTTLGEAQAFISSSKVGSRIQWLQQDPVQYLETGMASKPDFIVLAHSLFYLPSEEYTLSLLQKCRQAAHASTKLLLAEWGMRASTESAEAHVLAVKAQMAFSLPDANIRTVLEPSRVKHLVRDAGWTLRHDAWIEDPKLDDGGWEAVMARELLSRDGVGEEAKDIIHLMEEVAKKHDNVIRSMDVWTGVWSL